MIDARHLNASRTFIPLTGKENPFGRAEESYFTFGLVVVSKGVEMMDLVSVSHWIREPLQQSG
jgi:hypothetical protein